MATYFDEFRNGYRVLLGGIIGLGTGATLSFYTQSLFGPLLIADLGWSKAQFALVGTMGLFTMPLAPLIGRFADFVGPRVAVATGFSVIATGFVLLSAMTGPFWQFLAINFFFTLLGVLTSSMVLAGAIVRRFDQARGLALSLMMTASPVSGALVVPLIAWVTERSGWRAGYLALAAICATGGVLAASLIGRRSPGEPGRRAAVWPGRQAIRDIVANPAFLLLMAGMFLVNVPQAFASTQLKLIALDLGIANRAATAMLSLFAVGVLLGRLVCGLALDRLGTSLVGLVILGIPTASYLAFAWPGASVGVLTAAVLFVGMAQGAEGDIGAFVISRNFDHADFSLIYSLMNIMLGLGLAAGSLVVSITLAQGLGYRPFIVLCAVTALAGAILFSAIGWRGARPKAAESPASIS
jgi:predicted MFS family arabinose efflux permease